MAAFPNDIRPSRTEFALIANTQSFASPLNKAVQTLELPGMLWAVDMTFDDLAGDERLRLRGFLAALGGMAGRFDLWDQSHETPAGAYDSNLDTPVVDGGSQTGKTLATRGWRASGSALLKAGDYLEVTAAGAKSLHIVTADAGSDALGKATIAINPPLRSAPADGAALTLVRASATFMLAGDDQARWRNRAVFSSFTVAAMEAF